MKANEAPERIWMDQEWIPHFTENSIEYIRKDAFIEKAAIWLMLNADNYIVDGVEEHSSAMRHDFIEQFKKAMKDFNP